MKKKPIFSGLTSCSLHLLAMGLMLCDHLWATLFPGQEWLTWVGRMAFPIFAFLIAEGYRHTKNIRRYLGRLFLFAVLSEVPFNLMYASAVIYPFHQNVLWSFLLALLSIHAFEKVKAKGRLWLTAAALAGILTMDYLLGTLLMVDYFGAGVLMVFTFHLFHGKAWWSRLGQLVCLAVLNIHVLGGYYYPVTLFGVEFQLVQQGFALLALIPIWMYNGKIGNSSMRFRFACYVFYPAHMLVLYLFWQSLV